MIFEKKNHFGHRVLGRATGFWEPGGQMATGFQILISHTAYRFGVSVAWVHVFRIQTEIRIEIFILVIFEIGVNPLRKCLRKIGGGGVGSAIDWRDL